MNAAFPFSELERVIIPSWCILNEDAIADRLAWRLNIARRILQKHRAKGALSYVRADEYATRAGYHPSQIWTNWYETEPPSEKRWDIGAGTAPMLKRNAYTGFGKNKGESPKGAGTAIETFCRTDLLSARKADHVNMLLYHNTENTSGMFSTSPFPIAGRGFEKTT